MRKIRIVFGVFAVFFGLIVYNYNRYNIFSRKMSAVHAEQNVKYTYDSLGRVILAKYPDGTVIEYEYDRNGNLRYSGTQRKSESAKPDSTESKPAESQPQGIPRVNEKSMPALERQVVIIPHYTSAEIKTYNAFKKKKPVIKSLKQVKQKSKRYLKIQIRKVGKNASEMETGYKIQYAANSKFKKSKVISVEKNAKKSVTGHQWKVKKNKTYYVRIQAYMKTRTGRIIYTKYSKTKKISV